MNDGGCEQEWFLDVDQHERTWLYIIEVYDVRWRGERAEERGGRGSGETCVCDVHVYMGV